MYNARVFDAEGNELEPEEVVNHERYTIEENEWFKADVEDINGLLYIHITFKEFNHVILQYVKKRWANFKAKAFLSGYDEIFAYLDKPKFANMIDKDFKRIGHIESDLLRYEVIVCPSKPPQLP